MLSAHTQTLLSGLDPDRGYCTNQAGAPKLFGKPAVRHLHELLQLEIRQSRLCWYVVMKPHAALRQQTYLTAICIIILIIHADLYQAYTHYRVFMQIHWFSIINSCVTVLLLTGFLATILMRVLRKDFVKYTKDDDGKPPHSSHTFFDTGCSCLGPGYRAWM